MTDNPKAIRAVIHEAIYKAKADRIDDEESKVAVTRGLLATRYFDRQINQKLEEIAVMHAQHERLQKLMQELSLEMEAAYGRLYENARKSANYEISKTHLRQMIFSRDGWACRFCQKRTRLTIDHIVPVAKGGTSEPDNLQTLCQSCNSRKGTKV